MRKAEDALVAQEIGGKTAREEAADQRVKHVDSAGKAA
jgi:hypothetical protein